MSQTPPVFCLVAFLGIVTPGPTMLLALTNGSRLGVRASVPGMAGALVSDLVLITVIAAGLGALLAASEFCFSAVKWSGVLYLSYLGVRLLLSKGRLALTIDRKAPIPASPRRVFLRGFLVAVTNPKGYLFFSAFLPQFIAPSEPQLSQYAVLGITFTGIDFLVMFAYAAAGAQAIRFLRDNGVQWLDRTCGGALLVLASSLAILRRPT